jgi:hypothetical protein
MTADQFRRLALDLEDAIEGAHMGHPDFRANGRIFATLHAGDKTGMVALTPDEQREFLRTDGAMFEPSPGAWGRQGCTTVILKAAALPTIRAAMNLAWQRVMEMPPPRKRAAKSTSAFKAARPGVRAPRKAASRKVASRKATSGKAASRPRKRSG